MKEKIFTCIFCFIIFGTLIINVLKKDETISLTERRKLAQFPELNMEDIINGEAMESIEKYTLDQMIGRNQLRNMKTRIELQFLMKKDVHRLFIKDEAIYLRNEPLQETSVHNITNKMNELSNHITEGNVFYSIIPDKSYYLKDEFNPLQYDEMLRIMKEECSDFTYIDLFSLLQKDSYYRTDSHWKQDSIEPVAQKLISQMQKKYIPLEGEWNVSSPFYGVYYGQLGLDIPADEFRYITSPTFDDIVIYDVETNAYIDVYDIENLNQYEMYLSGPKAILKITNPHAKDNAAIIIFRDSFASSLIPLMIPSYQSITVVDTRYVNPEILDKYVVYDNQDVLFLYSTSLINQSSSLK